MKAAESIIYIYATRTLRRERERKGEESRGREEGEREGEIKYRAFILMKYFRLADICDAVSRMPFQPLERKETLFFFFILCDNDSPLSRFFPSRSCSLSLFGERRTGAFVIMCFGLTNIEFARFIASDIADDFSIFL